MFFAFPTCFDVQEADNDGEEATDGDPIEQKAVAVIGRQRHGALAHVRQALGESNHEQVVLILGVIHGELAEHGGEARVVGAGADQAKREYRVVGDLGVGVVRELAQRVEDAELGIGQADQAERQRHGSLDHRLAVVQQVAERAQRHLGADLLVHGDERDADDGDRLVQVGRRRVLVVTAGAAFFLLLLVLLGLFGVLLAGLLGRCRVDLDVLTADAQQLLDLEHVAGAGVGAHVHQNGGERLQRLGNGLQRLEYDVHLLALAQIDEADGESDELGECLLELGLALLEQRLHEHRGDLAIGRADGDQAERQRRHAHDLHARRRVRDDARYERDGVRAILASVCNAESN